MKTRVLALAAIAAGVVLADACHAQITPDFDFFVDAGQDTDGDLYWEDLVAGNPSGLGLLLDDSPAVNRVSAVTGTQLTHAYDFPGGLTGNEAGALLVFADSVNTASFQDGPGDWSNDPVTLEVWFKPDNLTPTPSNGQILFEDGGGTGLGLFVDNNELVAAHDGNENLISYDLSTDPSGLLLGAATSEFIQAVVTHDTASPNLTQLFINGQLVGTSNDDGDWSGGDGAAFGTRGESNTGGRGGGQSNTESFDGQIALVRIYNSRILTSEEVLANFNAVATPLGPIQFSDLTASNVTATAAQLYATVNTNLTSATVVWDTEDKGTTNMAVWAGSTNATGSTPGVVNGSAGGLQHDTTYVYRFYGESGGTNGWSRVGIFATALTASQTPVFTNAESLSPGVISLAWQDNALTETDYLLQRSDAGSGGLYVLVATLSANTTDYLDVGLDPETTYYYRLAATNTLNRSGTVFADCQTSATTPARPPDSLIYEPFDYTPGQTLSGLDGGTGWGGAWAAPRSNPTVTALNNYWGLLPTAGYRINPPSWSINYRLVGTTLHDAGLMADGAILWFSFVVDILNQNLTNLDFNFALCSDNFVNVYAEKANLMNNSEGIGVGNYRPDFLAAYWQDIGDGDGYGERATSSAKMTLNNTDNSRALIVGKIEWGANTNAAEKISLYAPAQDLVLPAPFVDAWETPALDQSLFDRLSIQWKDRQPSIDEIRFGATYEEVVGLISADAGGMLLMVR